jgi:hypothetical protein
VMTMQGDNSLLGHAITLIEREGIPAMKMARESWTRQRILSRGAVVESSIPFWVKYFSRSEVHNTTVTPEHHSISHCKNVIICSLVVVTENL